MGLNGVVSPINTDAARNQLMHLNDGSNHEQDMWDDGMYRNPHGDTRHKRQEFGEHKLLPSTT